MCMRQERDLEKEKKWGRDKREIKKWGGGGEEELEINPGVSCLSCY